LNAAKEKLEIVSGAAPPPFRIFAGGFLRRRKRRKRFGLIQEYCTKEKDLLEEIFSELAFGLGSLETPRTN